MPYRVGLPTSSSSIPNRCQIHFFFFLTVQQSAAGQAKLDAVSQRRCPLAGLGLHGGNLARKCQSFSVRAYLQTNQLQSVSNQKGRRKLDTESTFVCITLRAQVRKRRKFPQNTTIKLSTNSCKYTFFLNTALFFFFFFFCFFFTAKFC